MMNRQFFILFLLIIIWIGSPAYVPAQPSARAAAAVPKKKHIPDVGQAERLEKLRAAIPDMVPVPGTRLAICKYEITIREFGYFCRDIGPDRARRFCENVQEEKNPANLPVTSVSWYDASEYAAWLTDLDPRHIYRLPTSREWEYAAQAGANTDYYWSNNPRTACHYANIADQTAIAEGVIPPSMPSFPCNDGHARVAPAGSYRPNRFGLFDMIGNVWEWVQDCDPAYENSSGCSGRMVRGGSWFNGPKGARIRTTESYPPSKRHPLVGFRLVRESR